MWICVVLVLISCFDLKLVCGCVIMNADDIMNNYKYMDTDDQNENQTNQNQNPNSLKPSEHRDIAELAFFLFAMVWCGIMLTVGICLVGYFVCRVMKF